MHGTGLGERCGGPLHEGPGGILIGVCETALKGFLFAKAPEMPGFFHAPPPSVGGLDLDSRNSGCARLGGEVAPPLGPWVMRSRARSRRRRAQPRCAVCPQAFWMRFL